MKKEYTVTIHLNESYAELLNLESEIVTYEAATFDQARDIAENNDYEMMLSMGYEITNPDGEIVFQTNVFGDVISK